MTPEELSANRERFVTLLRDTGREGIENVLDYLERHDFYFMPSSLHRHHNWPGGLAQHCLGVYDRLSETAPDLPEDSKILTALLHDICKVRKLYKDDSGKWRERPEDALHYKGHGRRSVSLLEKVCGLKLDDSERRAIRFHMGGYRLPKEDLREFFANKSNDLWRLLMNADRYDASHVKKA